MSAEDRDARLADLTAFCVNNRELERLEQLIGRFNIFEAVGMSRQEVKHSRFLAFLLDPAAPHGLGPTFLEWFLQETLAGAGAAQLAVTPLDLHLWDLEDTLVEAERQSVDILITNAKRKFVVIVENKVNIGEHSDQLRRYRELMTRQYPGYSVVCLLLTPDGDDPSDENYIPVSYGQVATLVDQLVDRRRTSLSPDILLTISHYQELLRRHVLNNPEIDQLCADIYRKHKNAIDLIMERRGDPRMLILERVKTYIDSREDLLPVLMTMSQMEFIPKEWESLIPIPPKQFERLPFAVLIKSRERYASLLVSIMPGDQKVRQWLFDCTQEGIDGDSDGPRFLKKKTLFDKYCRIYKKEILKARDYEELLPDEMAEKVVEAIDEFVRRDLPKITARLRERRGRLDEAAPHPASTATQE